MDFDNDLDDFDYQNLNFTFANSFLVATYYLLCIILYKLYYMS
uniref:Uncharacterized protein n=1 Tax=Virus NIOZ-UU159 TaxID=2763270 RepID=A0A7S9SUS0_9VIRU|nr:MAG: hypothetical protein NIOZUU159_00104 [Virus NIOZ-UU159]